MHEERFDIQADTSKARLFSRPTLACFRAFGSGDSITKRMAGEIRERSSYGMEGYVSMSTSKIRQFCIEFSGQLGSVFVVRFALVVTLMGVLCPLLHVVHVHENRTALM